MLRSTKFFSRAYIEQQRELHARPEGYGRTGATWTEPIFALAQELGATSILDYGCGGGTLKTALLKRPIGPMRIDEYDPAIPGKDHTPSFADLVVCSDVLEHIEPPYLSAVLQHLKLLARKAVFVVISLEPSSKTLADGRNAHLIVESEAWWRAQILAVGFRVQVREYKVGQRVVYLLTEPAAEAVA